MINKKLWENSYFDRYLFVIIIAIELLMSFTFLGYIHVPPISITIAYMPVLAAGCLLGPVQTVMTALFLAPQVCTRRPLPMSCRQIPYSPRF